MKGFSLLKLSEPLIDQTWVDNGVKKDKTNTVIYLCFDKKKFIEFLNKEYFQLTSLLDCVLFSIPL